MTDEKWALEWNQNTNRLHIQTLASSLADAQKCFISNTASTWVTLMVGEFDACHRMADSWIPRLRERDLLRA